MNRSFVWRLKWFGRHGNSTTTLSFLLPVYYGFVIMSWCCWLNFHGEYLRVILLLANCSFSVSEALASTIIDKNIPGQENDLPLPMLKRARRGMKFLMTGNFFMSSGRLIPVHPFSPPPPPTTLIPHIEVGFKWMWTLLATPNKMAPAVVDLCAGAVALLPRQIRRCRCGFFLSAVLD